MGLLHQSWKYMYRLPWASEAYCVYVSRTSSYNPCSLSPQRRGISKETYQTYFSAESPPIGFAQDVLEGFHSVTGLPWWASIVLTTVTLRGCVTLPLQVYSYYILAKVENLQPEIMQLSKRLKLEVADAMKRFEWSEKYTRKNYNHNMKRLVKNLYIRDNCHPFKSALVMTVQIPMWVCLSFALRNMSGYFPWAGANTITPDAEVYTELINGGIFWFTNLTIPDSTWLLPVGLGILNLFIVEMHTLTKQKESRLQKIITNALRGVSLIMIPIAASVPSCICLYWASSSFFGFAQNILLKLPSVRRAVGIPHAPSESETPIKDMWRIGRNKYTFKKTQS